jgi:hypothetical protein
MYDTNCRLKRSKPDLHYSPGEYLCPLCRPITHRELDAEKKSMQANISISCAFIVQFTLSMLGLLGSLQRETCQCNAWHVTSTYPLCVDGEQVCVLKHSNQVSVKKSLTMMLRVDAALVGFIDKQGKARQSWLKCKASRITDLQHLRLCGLLYC